jgi:hypothetical protein
LAKKTKTTQRTKTLNQWLQGLDSAPKKLLRPVKSTLLRSLWRASAEDRQDLMWWWRVGKEINALFEDDLHYSASLMELLADALQPDRNEEQKGPVTLLYQIRKFAQVYSTEKQVRRLAEHCATGDISLQHVRFLLTVDSTRNSKTRDAFLKECLAKKWPANALYRRIQDDKRAFIRFGGRRPQVRTTTNPALAARDIAVRAEAWEASLEAYFGGDTALFQSIPASRQNQELVRELKAALEGLEKVGEWTQKGRNTLKPMVIAMERSTRKANRAR